MLTSMGIREYPELEDQLGYKLRTESIQMLILLCQHSMYRIGFPPSILNVSIIYLNYATTANIFSHFMIMTLLSRAISQGLPEQFSFVITYRNRQQPQRRWHLIRITNR